MDHYPYVFSHLLAHFSAVLDVFHIKPNLLIKNKEDGVLSTHPLP